MAIHDLVIGLAIVMVALGGVRPGRAGEAFPVVGTKMRVSPRQTEAVAEGLFVRADRDSLVMAGGAAAEQRWAWCDVREVEIYEARSTVGEDLVFGMAGGTMLGAMLGSGIHFLAEDMDHGRNRSTDPLTFCSGTGLLAGGLLGLALRPGKRMPGWQPMVRPAGASPYSVPYEPGLLVRVSAPAAGLTDYRAWTAEADSDSLHLRDVDDLQAVTRTLAWGTIQDIEVQSGYEARSGGGLAAMLALTALGGILGATVVDDSGNGDFAGENRFEATMMGLGAGAISGLLAAIWLDWGTSDEVWAPVRRPGD